jgi:hypothetical protein
LTSRDNGRKAENEQDSPAHLLANASFETCIRLQYSLFVLSLLPFYTIPSLKLLENEVGDLVRRELASEVGGDLVGANGSIDGVVDLGSGLDIAHELEHEGGGADRGDGVGDGGNAVGDVGGGTVNGLAYNGRASQREVQRWQELLLRRNERKESAPMMNESPTLTEGTRPREPTRAAAPSL